MPQSHSAVYVHWVFSTKERRPWLRDETIREELHAYIGGVSTQLRCAPIRVGGVEDHVHVLTRLGRNTAQSDWVKEVKRVSNLWLKTKGNEYARFRWQSGYAAFSVSQSKLEQVDVYIANQKKHHRRLSFQDELRALLTRHNIDFDERYVWD